ncbi:MAG: MarP family serine protease [Thermoleophilia bacterium]|nr:MarP family serine protease [Thermoleophilia bacterium]
MRTVDLVVLLVALVAALVGLRRGLLVSTLSFLGIALGAVLGGRLAPHFLPDGADSPYTPLVALAGAVALAFLLQGVGSVVGRALRGALPFRSLRTLDSLGGVVVGAAAGLAVVWVLGAVALQVPGQTELRQEAQRSIVLRRLNEMIPPRAVLRALGRVDPFPAIAGPAVLVEPPDAAVLRRPAVRRAAPSVVRILGTACGLGIAGSGWVAGRELVVTAAHVVAGQDDTRVVVAGGDSLPAVTVFFDARNDLAVLRVDGLRGRALRLTRARSGQTAAILGYPEEGSFAAAPGRVGQTARILGRDAYGNGPVVRTVTAFRGRVRHGNSGGPVVNAQGEVATTVFASRRSGESGYGVPTGVVRRALERGGEPVSTGECAP